MIRDLCCCDASLDTLYVMGLKAEYERINKLDKEKIRKMFKPSIPEDGTRDRYNNIRPYSHNIVRSKSKTGQKKTIIIQD